MKRFILSAVALSMLALPTVEAQAAPKHGPQVIERYDGSAHWNRRPNRHIEKRVMKKKVVAKRWARGKHVPAWQRKQVVRDYGRYGLRRPAYGQQWIRVGNDYLLISIASGFIAGMIAAH